MEDFFASLLVLLCVFVFALVMCVGLNEDALSLNDEYEKILKKEFGQVFDNYEDYVLYKIKDYNLKFEGDY